MRATICVYLPNGVGRIELVIDVRNPSPAEWTLIRGLLEALARRDEIEPRQ